MHAILVAAGSIVAATGDATLMLMGAAGALAIVLVAVPVAWHRRQR